MKRTGWAVVAYGVSAAASIFILAAVALSDDALHLFAPSPFEMMSEDDMQTLIHASQPRLRVDTEALSLAVATSAGRTTLTGNCTSTGRVVLSTTRSADSIVVSCHDGHYRASADLANASSDLTATQMTTAGEILVARLGNNLRDIGAKQELNTLAALQNVRGGYVKIAPGTYNAWQLILGSITEDSSDPLVIDGGGAAVFEGGTKLILNRANVTLRGFVFRGDTDITINAPNAHITESMFDGCGQKNKPKAQCILITAPDVEIDFNHFIGSNSMTIKVRADVEDAGQQPFNAYIHHNEFSNIDRHSNNGQEPIQVAGPGGGATAINLQTRIEHNVFFATNGDVETVSAKGPGVRIRWNMFFDMDSAPNLRGADQDEISGNLLVHTRPIRIAGKNHIIAGNIVLCPRDTGIALSHGSAHYAAAQRNTVTGNLVMSQKSAISFFTFEPPPVELASDNRIDGNVLITPSRYPAFSSPDEASGAMAASFAGINSTKNVENGCR
jgi:hypothetical protein